MGHKKLLVSTYTFLPQEVQIEVFHLVHSEALMAVFWDSVPCGSYGWVQFIACFCRFLAWLTLRPWRWGWTWERLRTKGHWNAEACSWKCITVFRSDPPHNNRCVSFSMYAHVRHVYQFTVYRLPCLWWSPAYGHIECKCDCSILLVGSAASRVTRLSIKLTRSYSLQQFYTSLHVSTNMLIVRRKLLCFCTVALVINIWSPLCACGARGNVVGWGTMLEAGIS
jgi:hypothetical protein